MTKIVYLETNLERIKITMARSKDQAQKELERIRQLMNEGDSSGRVTYQRMADILGVDVGVFKQGFHRGSFNPRYFPAIERYFFGEENGWIKRGGPRKTLKQLSEPYIRYNVKPDGYEFMHVPVLTNHAMAGYLSGDGDKEYIEELPKMLVPKEFDKGNYMVFEIVGDSMDNNDTRSLCDGDKVLAKELGKEHWKSPLYIHQYLFIIVTNDGVVCKQIVEQDFKKGTMTLHSFNQRYPDYTIDMKGIRQLFYLKKIVAREVKF